MSNLTKTFMNAVHAFSENAADIANAPSVSPFGLNR